MRIAPMLLLIALPALAGEAEWKARYDAAVQARMDMDMTTSTALFTTLVGEIEPVMKAELAKDKESEATGTAAYWLASAYLNQGRYPQAAQMLAISLEARRKRFGDDSAPVAEVYDRISWLGDDPDRSLAALRRALEIREKVYGPEHRAVAATLSDIGMNRLTAHRYAESEAAYARVVTIMEKVSGKDSLETAQALADFAWMQFVHRRYEEAIPLYRRALAIAEGAGKDDDTLAKALENLGYAYQSAKRYEEAEPLYLRALAIREKLHGPTHITTITVVGRLRDVYDEQGRTLDKWKMGRRLEAAFK